MRSAEKWGNVAWNCYNLDFTPNLFAPLFLKSRGQIVTDFDTKSDPLESPAASRQSYKIHELAKELGTSEEQVRVWLRESSIEAMSDEEHAEYHADTTKQLRTLQGSG